MAHDTVRRQTKCLRLDDRPVWRYSFLMTDRSVIKKRQRRPDARPAEILAAALSAFSEKGFSAARMDDVAKRAGISKGVIYLYFADKTALLKALVQQAVGGQIEVAALLINSHQGAVSPLIAQVVALFGTRLQETDLGKIITLVISESRAHPEIGTFYLDNVIRVAMPLMEKLIARGIAAGEFRAVDTRLAVKCMMGPMLLGAIWRSVFEPLGAEAIDTAALSSLHADILTRGLRP
jgi:AcrR family transcriptional regulator